MNFRLLLVLILAVPAVAFAQHGSNAKAEASNASDAAPKMHPLKGVVVEVMADKEALLVKHEKIPNVMNAMTMMFRVEAETLAKVKKGDAITAKMGRDESGKWILREVEVVKDAR